MTRPQGIDRKRGLRSRGVRPGRRQLRELVSALGRHYAESRGNQSRGAIQCLALAHRHDGYRRVARERQRVPRDGLQRLDTPSIR
jgi:hypothetical protein